MYISTIGLFMNLYKIFDFVSGLGCLIFALSFFFKRSSFIPERRLVFFYYVLGFGFIFRAIAHTYHSPTFDVAERLVFVLFPLAATLYIEQMARLKLPLVYKVYILVGGISCYLAYVIWHDQLKIPQVILLAYQVIAAGWMTYLLIKKILKSKDKVERSISLALSGFTGSTTLLLLLDWHLKMNMNEERITAILVFPFCYASFLFTFSGEGFSLRKVFKSSLYDICFLVIQGCLIYVLIPLVTVFQIFLILVLLLYVLMVLKILSVMFSSTENRRAHFVLEKINRLSKLKGVDILREVKNIDNIKDAKFLTLKDFELIGLANAYKDMIQRDEYFSRLKVLGARLSLQDDLDMDALQMITYTLDAFQLDFLFHIPNTDKFFGIKFEELNQDSSIEERAYSIFTQMTLKIYRDGNHG